MSIAALIPLLFAFAPQAAATDGALPAPTLPPGVSQDFQAAVRTVESALERGDFDAAKSALRLLPSPQFAIEYDDSKLPVELRQAGEAAIEAAAHDWSVDMTGVQIKIVRSHGDLKVDFTDKLAVPQGATMPSGLALIYSEAKDDPRLEAVIGVKRGEPLVESNVVDVSNDMKAAIGSYLGLAISPFFGTFMGTSDLSTNRPTTVFATEIHEARECLKVVTTLADAANSGKRMVSGSPKLFIDPTILELGESRQGDYVRFGIQVTNRGTAPMSYRLTPDCSCFSVVGPGTVDPGSSVFVRGVMSTAEYSGDIHKTLLLATSDPDQPMTKIPVHARINEMYRFIAPQGSLVVASDAAMVYHLYLALAPD